MLILLGLAGCAGNQVRSIDPADRAKIDQSGMRSAPPPPIAYWKMPGDTGRGDPIHPDQFEGVLVELSGRRALQELVLDRMLARELAETGKMLDGVAVDREETILLMALDEDLDRAIRLLQEVRTRDGLGPVRYQALLRRNAILRLLVEDQIEIGEESIIAAWDRDHGPRRVARVLVVQNLAATAEINDQLQAGVPFAELAAARSTDPSASTGGLLDPISRLDPSWPTSFREVLWSLEPGTVSTPVLVGENYVLIQCLKESPGDGINLEDVREESERVVRRARERLLMDSTARSLLEAASIDIIDTELKRAFDERPEDLRSAVMPNARTRPEAGTP
jgi:parvulin-like peptidyl-prolyl isomerase